METYRQQGAARELRILKAMPMEIQGLLADFAEHDRRVDELENAKEKHKHGLK